MVDVAELAGGNFGVGFADEFLVALVGADADADALSKSMNYECDIFDVREVGHGVFFVGTVCARSEV